MGDGLHLGDCIDIMRTLPDASIDLILCDLPYGTTQNKWDALIPFADLWREYDRLCTGAVVLTAAQPFTAAVVMSNPKAFRYEIVWEKSKATGFLNAKRQPLRAHESILVFSRAAPPYYPQMTPGEAYDKGVRKAQTDEDTYGRYRQRHIRSDGGRYPRSVIRFATAEREGGYHKAQKPVALMEYLVRTYSRPGETVLDNAMGSGTTGVACVRSGRRFVGIELEPAYFEIARQRVEAARDFERKAA